MKTVTRWILILALLLVPTSALAQESVQSMIPEETGYTVPEATDGPSVTVCAIGNANPPTLYLYGEPGHWGPLAAGMYKTSTGWWCGTRYVQQGYWSVFVGALPWGCTNNYWSWQWVGNRYYEIRCGFYRGEDTSTVFLPAINN